MNLFVSPEDLDRAVSNLTARISELELECRRLHARVTAQQQYIVQCSPDPLMSVRALSLFALRAEQGRLNGGAT